MTAPPPTQQAGSPRTHVATIVSTFGPLIGLVFVWGLFALLAGSDFAKIDNQRLMLLQTAVVGTAAVGATLIIISGGIDLSVGSTIALGTVVIALLLRSGAPPLLAALGGVGTGLACGAVMGAMVVGHIGRVAALVAAALVVILGWSAMGGWLCCVVAALVFAGLLLANERFLKRLPIAPFIVTLGMWGALRGLAKGLGDNQPV
jgi:ribose/xylose/arabinose/galactoside ABC-type transport system permease subunit